MTAELTYAGMHAVHQCIEQAFTAMTQVEQLMSFHHPASELSRLNQQAYYRTVKVHPLIYAVLWRAQRVFLASHGLFDCTVANTLVEWNLLPQHNGLPDENTTQASVQLLRDCQVRFSQPLLLDLGGIAKGFAVDLAVQVLKKGGVTAATVNAGGDLRVLGSQAEVIWVRHPANPTQLIAQGELSHGAFATSGIYYSQQSAVQQQVNALVNPFTRTAVQQAHSYSVIARTAWLADALTKVLASSGDVAHPCLSGFGATGIIIQ